MIDQQAISRVFDYFVVAAEQLFSGVVEFIN
jgi:hypothetical protein